MAQNIDPGHMPVDYGFADRVQGSGVRGQAVLGEGTGLSARRFR